ncbi:hypothetical protein AeMF1_018689 [Aphanomyces euteiches]|nr:hypothetical protein AeMF1_018689 [Aphanomyces euteiches]KAH9184813.1 hypothetical protein AeNC1_013211 [Aphanomyces euteiches]
MRISLPVIFASCALGRRQDQPNDAVAFFEEARQGSGRWLSSRDTQFARHAAEFDNTNRVLRGNEPKIGPKLSKQEENGRAMGRKVGKAVGGGVGAAGGAAAGLGLGGLAGPGGAVAGAAAGALGGRLGGELAGKKIGAWLGAKIGRHQANSQAKKGQQILKTLTQRNPELKAVSDKGSRISKNQPRPLMQRITRSNSSPSSISLDKGPKPNPAANKPTNQRVPNPASKTNRQKMIESKNNKSARRN